MRRRVFAFVSALSLLLCVASVAVWINSYRIGSGLIWTEPQRLRVMGVTRGAIFASVVQQGPTDSGYFGPPHGRTAYAGRPAEPLTMPNLLTAEWGLAGFEFAQRSPPLTFRRLVVPCWALALASAAAPALWYGGRLRQSRQRGAGFCRACGYDLRGSPEGCPECGAGRHAA